MEVIILNRRTLVEFISAWMLVLVGGITTLLPLFNFTDLKSVFIVILTIYVVVHLIKNILIIGTKDYSGFITSAISIVTILMILSMDVSNSPWNLSLILFVWVILMSLNKLKESDYYHDHKNKLWVLNIVNLLLFILCGILTAVNLFYMEDIQIIILGFFFLIHGVLEIMDPLVAYILEKK